MSISKARSVNLTGMTGGLILLCQIMHKHVILAWKRVSSAMDGRLKSIHGAWIPAIHAGMTIFENCDYVI
jgi:hypothetical protein